MTEIKVSRSQLEVWEWKETLWKEVAHLDTKVAIHKILSDSIETERKFGLKENKKKVRT